MSLYDFRFPHPRPVEYCFRFCADFQPGPPDARPIDEGEIKVWLFINEQWYGPYPVGLRVVRRNMATTSAELDNPERLATHKAIYEARHWFTVAQGNVRTSAAELTGELLIQEYKRLALPQPCVTID